MQRCIRGVRYDMIINSKENFTDIVMQLLKGLGYENITPAADGGVIDLTAVKDDKKYAFKCKYHIDAISEKDMNEFFDAAQGGRFDGLVYVTNSSFAVSAKRKAEEKDIELWDRNTFDRMAITVSDKIEDKKIAPKRHTGLIIGIAFLVIAIIGAAAYYYFFYLKK